MLHPSTASAIRREYRKNGRVRVVAQRLGLAESTVRAVVGHDAPLPVSQRTIDRIRSLRSAGHTYSTIVDVIGATPYQVRTYARDVPMTCILCGRQGKYLKGYTHEGATPGDRVCPRGCV